jgi:RecB family endonuclease NucS
MNDEAAFSVVDNNIQQLIEVTLKDIGFKERHDLQRWIEDYPEIIGPDLLVVTTEFDRWEFGSDQVRDRLDILFLDSAGSLVVAELKRGEAPDTVDLQALKYAAYCSQLTVEDVVADYARYHQTDEQTAREIIIEYAPSLERSGVGLVKVRLVAESFKPSVTSMVLWLRDYELDIGCVEVSARRLPDGNAIITSRQLLPLPVAEDYLVRRRRREKDEEQREASGRSPNTVTVLLSVVCWTW